MDKLEILAATLSRQGYIAHCFTTRQEAVVFLDQELDQQTIGIGGSQTVAEMELFLALASHNTVYWHDAKPEHMTIAETRQAAFRAPVYISSVNAISEDGDINLWW